jgi:hypothetical protein
MADETDDISADLAAAFAADAAAAPDAPAPPPPAVEAPDLSLHGAEPTAETKAADRARDEAGRFAAKAADDKAAKAVQAPQVTAQELGSESPSGEIAIPRSLSPEAKAQFKDWPALARNEFLRREADTARGVEKLQQELRRYEPLEAILAPHREKWQLHGTDEVRAVQTLLAAQNFLERDPVQALQYLAKSYGVQLGQADPNATPSPQADPQIRALTQQVQTLSQRLQAQDHASHSQRLTETLSAIEQFAQDPKHVYFDNVRDDMSRLLESGAATSLPDAYQKATWSNETIRNLMLAEQQRGTQADEEARRQQHAQQAREAGVSITGSLGPGASHVSPVDPNSSIDDDVRRAFQQLAGRV